MVLVDQHFKLYKPVGMLSQLDSNDLHQQRKKRFLSELYDFPEGSMPIGRLDEKSEGLLLMTTDGKISDHINSSGMEKEYHAQLDGLISDQALEQLRQGLQISVLGKPHFAKAVQVRKLETTPELPPPHSSLRVGTHRPNSWISLTLNEGKFRQVRKMTAAVGFPTLRLVRVRVGKIHLDGLKEGAVCKIKSPLLYS
ncbi:pseudouridine synthase [Croceiramulus getboli]|nr:pseudouridine synthase [Flavobacteriaceae bacterium YJPT1-3]